MFSFSKVSEFSKRVTILIVFGMLGFVNVINSQPSSDPFKFFTNFSGNEDLFVSQGLMDRSLQFNHLVDSLNPSYEFQLGGVDLYPLAEYFYPTEGVEYHRDIKLAEFEALQGGYLVFFVSYDDKGREVYSYSFKFPAGGGFDNFTATEREVIEIKLNSFFIETNDGGIEIARLSEKTINKLYRLLDRQESLAFDYEELGFVKLIHETTLFPNLDQGVIVNSSVLETQRIYDYSGLYIDGSSLGEQFSDPNSELEEFEMAIYLTSDYNAAAIAGRESAAETFGNENEKVSLWLAVEWVSESDYNIWGKSSNNLSREDGMLFVANYFEENQPGAVAFTELNVDEAAKSTDECTGKARSIDELLTFVRSGKYTHGKDWTAYCIGVNIYPSTITIPTTEQVAAGLTAGLVDGLAGTVSGLLILSKGLIEVMVNTPFTRLWGLDLIRRTFLAENADAALRAPLDKFFDSAKFYYDMYNMAKAIANNIGQILAKIKTAFYQFFQHLNPASGWFSTFHSIGLVAFEILVDFFTSGSATFSQYLGKLAARGANIAKTSTKIAALGGEIVTKIGSPLYWHRHIDNLGRELSKVAKMDIKRADFVTSVGNCFIASTLVATNLSGAPLMKPIEDVQLFDLVYSDPKRARKDEDLLTILAADPLVSADQIWADLDRTAKKEKWLKGDFVGLDGKTVLSIARPDSWFKTLSKTGSNGYLIELPEMEVLETFWLKDLTPVSDKHVELLQLDGDLQPVTATISRNAPLVLSLVTDNDTIGVTPEHRFFSHDRQEWVPAGELELAERLSTRSGVVNLLSLDTLFRKPTPVYNLEVRRNHTYHVGKNELLVHNNYGRRLIEEIRKPGYVPDPNNKWANFVKNMDQGRLDQFLDELSIASVGKIDERVKWIGAWDFSYGFPNLRIRPEILEKLNSSFDNVLNDIQNVTDDFIGSNTNHLDLGGHNRYPSSVKMSYEDVDYANIPIANLVQGNMKTNLPKIPSEKMDRITIENAPFSDDILSEIKRVTKRNGSIELEHPSGTIPDYNVIANKVNGTVVSIETFTRTIEGNTLEFTRSIIIKK